LVYVVVENMTLASNELEPVTNNSTIDVSLEVTNYPLDNSFFRRCAVIIFIIINIVVAVIIIVVMAIRKEGGNRFIIATVLQSTPLFPAAASTFVSTSARKSYTVVFYASTSPRSTSWDLKPITSFDGILYEELSRYEHSRFGSRASQPFPYYPGKLHRGSPLPSYRSPYSSLGTSLDMDSFKKL
jgi:hypothetical protein